jgi:acetyltransferase-like isoleucine patch superfamily enzyme
MAIPIIKMLTVGILPSPLKVLYYKLTGSKIGKGVSIGLLSIIDAKEIEIGDNSKIGHFSFITCRKLHIGKRVKINMMVAIETGEVSIDNDSTIMEQVVIGGMLTPRSTITIGKRVKIFPYSFLNPTEAIIIEDDVGIGGANYIFTHGSWQSILDGFPVSFGPVTIKKGTWFPWRVFVMPNVTVGEYCTIGAGSIITKSIPERSLAAGAPAKVLKQGAEYIKQYSADEKVGIINNILTDFTEFLKYKYFDKSDKIYSKVENDLLFISVWDGRKICFSKGNIDNIQADAIIFFNEISEPFEKQLTNENKIWFDILGEKTFFNKDPLWKEIIDFFSRYGIRFEIK